MRGGGVLGLLSVRPHFCWGGVGAAKGLLPCFLVPKRNQPTACTLALWWLKFGPTEAWTRGRGGLEGTCLFYGIAHLCLGVCSAPLHPSLKTSKKTKCRTVPNE